MRHDRPRSKLSGKPGQGHRDLTPQEEQLREALLSHYPELETQLGSIVATRKEYTTRARTLRYRANDVAEEEGWTEQAALFLAQEGEDIARRGFGVIGVEDGIWKVLNGSWFYRSRDRLYQIGGTADDSTIQTRFINVAGFVDDWVEVQAVRVAVVAKERAVKDYHDQLATIVLTHARLGSCDLCPQR